MTSQVDHVCDFVCGGWKEFALHRQVVVGVVRNLERGCSRHSQSIGAIRDCVRTGWLVERRVVDGRGLQEGRILEGVLFPNTVEKAVVEDAETAPAPALSPPITLLSKADPRPTLC